MLFRAYLKGKKFVEVLSITDDEAARYVVSHMIRTKMATGPYPPTGTDARFRLAKANVTLVEQRKGGCRTVRLTGRSK
jgi:hypothetical protein